MAWANSELTAPQKCAQLISSWNNDNDPLQYQILNSDGPLKFVMVEKPENPLPRIFFIDQRQFPFHSDYVRNILLESDILGNLDRKTPAETLDGIALNHDILPNGGYIVYGETILIDSTLYVQFKTLKKKKRENQRFLRMFELAFRNQSNDNLRIRALSSSSSTPKAIQVHFSGRAFGRLRYISKIENEKAIYLDKEVNDAEILVFEEAPDDLPIVDGVISLAPISPLSHSVMLARSLKIPFVSVGINSSRASQNAIRKRLRSLDRHWIELRVEAESFEVIESDETKSYESFHLDFEHLAPLNLLFVHASGLDSSNSTDVLSFGPKVANLAELWRFEKSLVASNSFALPFGAFKEFLKAAKTLSGENLATVIEEKIRFLEFETSLTALERGLAEIRGLIRNGTRLENEVDYISSLGIGKFLNQWSGQWIVRSSGAAEDSDRFSAAGLHASVCSHINSPSELLRAMREVYASLFSLRAYLARRKKMIPEGYAFMGLLIQPMHPPSKARGVALVTCSGENIVDIELAVAKGTTEDSVVRPQDGFIAKTAKLRLNGTKIKFSKKSFPDILQIIGASDLSLLVHQLARVASYFQGRSHENKTFDIEWTLTNDSVHPVLIDQVRNAPRGQPREASSSLPNATTRSSGMQAMERYNWSVWTESEGNSPGAALFAPRALSIKVNNVDPRKKYLDLSVDILFNGVSTKKNYQKVRVAHDSSFMVPVFYLEGITSFLSGTVNNLSSQNPGLDDLQLSVDLKDLGIYNSYTRDAVVWNLLKASDKQDRMNTMRPKLFKYSDGSSLEIELDTLAGGNSGSSFYVVRSAEIRGLTDRPLEVSIPEGLSFGTSHHDGARGGFPPTFVVDLWRAKGITREEARVLRGRYLKGVVRAGEALSIHFSNQP